MRFSSQSFFLCLVDFQQMMWALEYDPTLFLLYEDPESSNEQSSEGSKGKTKTKSEYGKYERAYMKNAGKNNSVAPLPLSVFLVASVLKEKSPKLLAEARGLDDVVKVSFVFSHVKRSKSLVHKTVVSG